MIPLRDPETGELNFKVSIDIHLVSKVLPFVVECSDWRAAAKYLASAEFRRISADVDLVSISNREARS